MNKEERDILLAIREGMVTLVEQTTALLVQGRWGTYKEAEETKARLQATATDLTEKAAAAAPPEGAEEQFHIKRVERDGFTKFPEPIPLPAPARPTPDNPSPAMPTLTEEEQEVGKVWHINDMLIALGIQLKTGGTVEINWDMFAEAIGPQQGRELSNVLEERYGD
jgi:hypothetical protein